MPQASANTASEPSATPQSAPQASATAAGSSWDAVPVLIPSNLVLSSYEEVAQPYWQYRRQIRTRFSCDNRLQDWYNFRLSTINPPSLREQLSWVNPPSLKSTCLLVCATPKQVPSSTITTLPTIIWCWNSLFWSPIKTIYNACMTKSVILISWRGFASKGPAVNGWWIWSLMWRGLFGKSGIIPSAEEHFFLHI